jgi:hypothetical protein
MHNEEVARQGQQVRKGRHEVEGRRHDMGEVLGAEKEGCMSKRGGSVSEGKKRKRKNMNELTAVSQAPCRKVQHARIQEKGGPPQQHEGVPVQL